MRITIDIKRDIISYGLYARKIWEKLFRFLNLEKMKELDSFLCDLKCFERFMDAGIFVFYWQYNMSGRTEVWENFPRHTDNSLRIHVIPGQEIIITQIEVSK